VTVEGHHPGPQLDPQDLLAPPKTNLPGLDLAQLNRLLQHFTCLRDAAAIENAHTQIGY
jgi:hypothetical protein